MHDPSRHGHKLGEAAVPSVLPAGDTQHLAAGAEVLGIGAAVCTGAAEDRRVEDHAIPRSEVGHTRPERVHGAGRLVSHHKRRNPPTGRPGVAVHIAAADPAGGDPNADLTHPDGRQVEIG